LLEEEEKNPGSVLTRNLFVIIQTVIMN